VRLQDDNAVYRKNLGLALQQQGELDGAIGEYKVALRLLPDFVDVHMGLGEIFEFQGKRDDAIVAYRTASRIRPNFADAHNYLAWVMAKKSDCSDRERAEALEHARLAVSLSPEDGGIQNTLSLAEYRAGHWAESIAAARRSIALAKDADASNGFFLAMAVWQQGDLDRARSHFDEAVSLAEKADPRRIELVAFWREAAGLLGQPGPTAGAPTPHRPD
jgi:tetratricopeptide (TPR) repeat protein